MGKVRKKAGGIGHVREIAEEIAGKLGISVIDVKMAEEEGHHFLRVILDKPDGITIKDCEDVSRQLSPRLDEADVSTTHYFLEVSSPGTGTGGEEVNDEA